jgi:hypothetical protein
MPASIYEDAQTLQAYLFQCDDNGLYAVSLDASGANLPRGPCAEGWRFKVAFRLGFMSRCLRQLTLNPSCAASAPGATTFGVKASPTALHSRAEGRDLSPHSWPRKT